jgi:hypothetical protein
MDVDVVEFVPVDVPNNVPDVVQSKKTPKQEWIEWTNRLDEFNGKPMSHAIRMFLQITKCGFQVPIYTKATYSYNTCFYRTICMLLTQNKCKKHSGTVLRFCFANPVFRRAYENGDKQKVERLIIATEFKACQSIPV